MSGEQFLCADDVVVVGELDLNDISAAAQLAAALGGPLLFPHPLLASELGRLQPVVVHVVGNLDIVPPPGARLLSHTRAEAAGRAGEALGTAEFVDLFPQVSTATISEAVMAVAAGDRVAVAGPDPVGSDILPEPHIPADELIESLAVPSTTGEVWLVAASSPAHILLATSASKRAGASVVAFDATDLLAYPVVSNALTGRTPSDLRFVGTSPHVDPWHLEVLINGRQVPGGGFVILPEDRPRRYVAFYGHPVTSALGALGEQGPEATIERLQSLLAAYEGDGSQTVPTFEIIATVAAASATDDGDYSFEWPASTFEDWVAAAEAGGAYVILDLQPGRDDFLSQAMQYEDLLRSPNVGLALDPEWRLKPDQVHLKQVGRVSAEEVNSVINWLADLVRENGLPQKMLIVHQFRTFMIQDRDLLENRPEIQLVIQMDGNGTETEKDNTYATLTEGTETAFWAWGWKNFFDEDVPGPPTPQSTMGKNPVPVYVSYQ